MLVHAEFQARLVHVWPQRLNAHHPTFVHKLGYFRYVGKVSTHHGSHIFGRIMRFEVRRLESHPRVTRGMTLVKGVRSKLFPVFPNLVEHFLWVSVFHSALVEQRFQLIHLRNKFLTHCLSQRVALSASKVGQLPRQQHHLLLIHRNAVRIFKILLHARDVVLHLRWVAFTRNEVGNVVHWPRTIKGVHGNEVFKHRGLQLAQVFLHASRLKLERPDGSSLAIKLVGFGVVDGYFLQVDGLSRRYAHVFHGLFQYGKCLQSQEVHLDKPRFFDNMPVILRTKQLMSRVGLILGSRNGHPIANRITTDDCSTGMNARSAHRAFQHLGIHHGVAQPLICRCLRLAQLWNSLNSIGHAHLQAIGQFVGNKLAQVVHNLQRHLFHTSNVLNRVFRGHRSVGNDVRHLVVSVLIFYPFQHAPASVIVEVGINIGQRDTVGVKETFEKQVVLDGVYLRYAQTISHNRACRRPTSRPNHHVQFVLRRVDKVLHDKEVAWKAHCFHNVQFKVHTFAHLLCKRLAI